MRIIQWPVLLLIAISPFLSNGQNLSENLKNSILNASQGDIVLLPNFLSEEIPKVVYEKIVLPGPQLIVSDDPEYIKIPEGIVLQEIAQPGAVRLYIYNVNGVEKPQKLKRKITAVIKNKGADPMHLRMLKYSSQKPSTNYYKIGKEGLADFFASFVKNDVRIIQPGEAISIDPKLENHKVSFNELVHGIYEFVIDQPGEISVLQTDPNQPGKETLNKNQNVLPSSRESGAGRGSFGVSNYHISNINPINTQSGTTQLIVADGIKDPWVIGKEYSSGDKSELAGNYGVMYDIDLKWKSPDGKAMALVTWNARAGNNKWCGGMASSMVVSKGKFKAGVIQLPNEELITKEKPEAILIQIFIPDDNKEIQNIKLKYSPPGASCLPTPLILIPIETQKN